MDDDGYPEDDELDKIRTWDFHLGFLPLMDYVKSLWNWNDTYFCQIDENHFELHTGGWSGNEEIIGAMKQNTMFWLLCWEESRRGGHYKFEVKKVHEMVHLWRGG